VKEYDLFIPLYVNDGRPVEPQQFQALQQQLLDQFGGLTFFPQPNEGFWTVVKRRNNLHYLIADDKWLSGTRLDHLFYIRACYREFVIKLCDELSSEYRVPPVVSDRKPVGVLGPLWNRLVRMFQ